MIQLTLLALGAFAADLPTETLVPGDSKVNDQQILQQPPSSYQPEHVLEQILQEPSAQELAAPATPTTSWFEAVQNMLTENRAPFFAYSRATRWFKDTFDYVEARSPTDNQEQMKIHRTLVRPFGTDEDALEYIAVENKNTGRSVGCGAFQEYTSAELTALIHDQNDKDSATTRPSTAVPGEVKVTEQIVQDAYGLNGAVAQCSPDEPSALVQAASQFNYLEMVSQRVVPSRGFTAYPSDPTQGPRCAVATPGATWVRNHILTSGDDEAAQLNGMRSVMKSLGDGVLSIENGYVFSGPNFAGSLPERAAVDETARRQLEELLLAEMSVGFSFDAETISQTKNGKRGYVSSAWCSAIPLGYMSGSMKDVMKPLARAVLKATYKATILAAIAHGKETVYLTEVGGGVFGNSQESITEAIAEAVSYAKEQNFGRALEVKVVSWIGDVEDWYGKHGGKYGSAVREPRAQALKAIRLDGFADAM